MPLETFAGRSASRWSPSSPSSLSRDPSIEAAPAHRVAMRWPSTRRRGDRVDATVAADPPTTQARATTRADELERALALERRARALERDAARDDAEAAGERLARTRADGERSAEERERALAREAEALARCATAEGALEDVCRAATAFATACAERGLVEADVARAAENDPMIWIERDGTTRERVGDLLTAVLDAHVAACADYETKLAYARARPPSSDDVEAYEARLRAEVERLLEDMALERSSPSSGGKKLYRTPDVKSGRSRGAEMREIEAERRELQETLAEVQRRMHTLAESSDAIESELREQLNASRRESAELRAEMETVLEERSVVVNKLEVELRRLERSQEDADQETRRLSLSAREKDAEIATLKRRAEDLASEGARLNETLDKQRQLKDKLEEQLAASEARVEGLLQEIDAMDAASAQASMHVSNAMASASEAHQRSLQEMRAKQAEAEAYIESLDSRLGALEEERNALRRELDRAYAREKDARVRLQETEKRSNELTGEINALLEQDARRNSVREHAMLEHVARTPPRVSSRFARANGASTSTKKLHVHEVSDEESDGEEFVVIRRRSATAPNSPFMVADSPRGARQFNGLNSVNSALARARAEFIEARAKRDRTVRKMEEF